MRTWKQDLDHARLMLAKYAGAAAFSVVPSKFTTRKLAFWKKRTAELEQVSEALPSGDGPWSQMAEALECCHAKTVGDLIDHAKWLVESYKAQCYRLQSAVQRHRLGLGGEKVDKLVCDALDAALSSNAGGTRA